MLARSRSVSFSVDTHLLRELGTLLVGRDSTALLELIKNSYDADATRVTVHAEGLTSGDGRIVISDDGLGMTLRRFEEVFLRIAGRSKEGGQRRSPKFNRRFSGAKGIGRLAAHKLSSRLELSSVPDELLFGEERDEQIGVRALLDWDTMESEHIDLDNLGDSLQAYEIDPTPGEPSGTTLSLEHVREPWSPARLSAFLSEVRSFRPANVFQAPLPATVVSEPIVFEQAHTRDTGPDDEGFEVEFVGDLEEGEDLWMTLAQRADWILEIDANASRIIYGISPTIRRRDGLPKLIGTEAAKEWSSPRTYRRAHPSPTQGPFFQARMFVTEGSFRGRFEGLRAFERRESGIRLFLEGFRVLPYGGQGDDWLRLDADSVSKNRELRTPDSLGFDRIEEETYVQLGNRGYYGAVFLTEEGASQLQALVNREGFVPDDYFRTLTEMVRTGPDLVTRTRAAIRDAKKRHEQNEAERKAAEERRKAAEAGEDAARRNSGDEADPDAPDDQQAHSVASDPDSTPYEEPSAGRDGESHGAPGEESDVAPDHPEGWDGPSREVRQLVSAATDAAASMRVDTTTAITGYQRDTLTSLLTSISLRIDAAEEEQVNLRTLATVGAQYSGFIHEINGLLAQAQTLRQLLSNLATRFDGQGRDPSFVRSELRPIINAADELVLSLTRQASYLTDVVGPDARRRRTRLPARERVQAALRLLEPRIRSRGLRVTIDIDPGIRTPPLFGAELAIITTNLMSNAIKFAGENGQVRISARLGQDYRFHLIVENTGDVVDKGDRERFFRPFESSTTEVDVLLGQGMGLGLSIVRNLAEDYAGEAKFIDPSPGFATAVQVSLPEPRPDIARRQASK